MKRSLTVRKKRSLVARRKRSPSARTEAQRKRSAAAATSPDSTVGDLVHAGARRFARARLAYGHGTDNPLDEAAALVFHALELDHADAPAIYSKPVSAAGRGKVERLFERRIRERLPAAYLMKRMWFMGLEFQVDRRVLVPRSPIAELIERRFAPWVDPARVNSILDIGTGSGCIAIACAVAFPRARVDGVDVSLAALTVARNNIGRHRLAARVRAVRSDHFSALGVKRYDIIVSNPPYVGRREFRALPREYRHEPAIALASGGDGLDSVRVILREAAEHLRPAGILVVEVGNSETAVQRAFPRVPFTWLEFENGGGGVFLLTCAQLEQHGADFRRARRSRKTLPIRG